MAVGDDAFQIRQFQERRFQSEVEVEWVGQSLCRGDSFHFGGERILTLNGEAGTGSSDGYTALDCLVDRGGEWRALPVANVIPLIATSNEDGCGLPHLIEHKRIARAARLLITMEPTEFTGPRF